MLKFRLLLVSLFNYLELTSLGKLNKKKTLVTYLTGGSVCMSGSSQSALSLPLLSHEAMR